MNSTPCNLAIEKIVEGTRSRQDYGDLTNLIESIKAVGGELIQTLAVLDQGDGTYKLIAGGRRLRALHQMEYKGLVPCLIFKSLDEYMLRNMELRENVDRLGMTYAEEVKLKADIHELYISKHGAASPGRSSDTNGWSIAQTAKVLDVDRSGLAKDLKLAQAIEDNPKFAKFKSKQDAMKALYAQAEQVLIEELSKRHSKETKAKGVNVEERIENLASCYLVDDFFAFILAQGPGIFDFAHVDPPYGIDLDEVKQHQTEDMNHYNEVKQDDFPAFFEKVAREVYRTLKGDAWAVFWHGYQWEDLCRSTLEQVGFQVGGPPALWVKQSFAGQTNAPTRYLSSCYEQFLYVRKGQATIIKPGHRNIFLYKPVTATDKMHPTEKPLDLIKDIYETFTLPGSIILSPFLGSGVDLLAAEAASMSCIGTDLSQAYRENFLIRLSQGLKKETVNNG